MPKDLNIRWGWLKVMYVYTIVGAGGCGLAIIISPQKMQSVFRLPTGEPVTMGIVASVYVAFGLLSVLGLRSPLKFVPVLFLQLCYKSVWFICIILPLLISGQLPGYAVTFMVIFASYIVGDLIAIPFSFVFAKQADR